MLLRGARIVGRADQPAVDLVVDGGLIRAVGVGLRYAGEVVDADGRWVMPGLWDKHVHLGQWALARRRIDLSGTPAAAAVLDRVRAAPDDGRPLIGFGHRIAGWSVPPRVGDLDALTGRRPAVLISGDAHNGWLNSAALDLAGLPRRDDVVAEREWFDAFPRLAEVFGLVATDGDYADAIGDAHRLGVTGLVDLEFEPGFTRWPERHAVVPPMRVRTGVYPDDLDAALAAGLRTGDSLGGLVTMGPLKVIVDGSLGTRTAYCCTPYADDPETVGVINYESAELVELMRQAVEGGLEVTLHAIGDAALDAVLSAFETTRARGSVEHAQLARPADLPRLAALGLTASVQPAHLLDDRDIADVCWADRTERTFMLRSMLDHGVALALGSDAPVAPLDPWLAIDAAVRRCAEGDEPWHPEQRITRWEALLASVDGRRVATGELADLVLLDDDPLQAPRPRVAATFVAGERVYG